MHILNIKRVHWCLLKMVLDSSSTSTYFGILKCIRMTYTGSHYYIWYTIDLFHQIYATIMASNPKKEFFRCNPKFKTPLPKGHIYYHISKKHPNFLAASSISIQVKLILVKIIKIQNSMLLLIITSTQLLKVSEQNCGPTYSSIFPVLGNNFKLLIQCTL